MKAKETMTKLSQSQGRTHQRAGIVRA